MEKEAKPICTAEERMDAVVGCQEIKEELRRFVLTAKNNTENGVSTSETLHWVLKGNPGTGKGMMAKVIGDMYKEAGILKEGHIVEVTRSDFVAEYVAQTVSKTQRGNCLEESAVELAYRQTVLKTQSVIEQALGGVLLINKVGSFTNGEDVGLVTVAIHALTEAMTDHNKEFVVIVTGYPQEMDVFLEKNPEFARKFKVFTIEDYTPEELHQIFTMTCKASEYDISSELEEMMDGFFQKYKEMESETRVWENAREAIRLAQGMLKIRQKEAVKEGYRDGYRELFRSVK